MLPKLGASVVVLALSFCAAIDCLRATRLLIARHVFSIVRRLRSSCSNVRQIARCLELLASITVAPSHVDALELFESWMDGKMVANGTGISF